MSSCGSSSGHRPSIGVMALAALCVALAAPVHAAAPGWQDTPFLRDVVARAGAEHRVVLVRVGRRFCAGCARLDRVLARPAVAAGLKAHLRVSYEAGAGEGQDVARRYNVVVFPTVLVLGPDGQERGRISGDPSGRGLAQRVEALRRQDLDGSSRQARRRPGDLELALRVGAEWAARGERRRAEEHLLHVVHRDPGNRRGLAAPALLALGDSLYLRSLSDHAAAERTLRRLRESFPRTRESTHALLPLARAMAGQGRGKEGLGLLAEQGRGARGQLRLARYGLLTGDPKRGLTHAEKATTLAPRDGEAWATLAELLQRAGRIKAARAAWRRAKKD